MDARARPPSDHWIRPRSRGGVLRGAVHPERKGGTQQVSIQDTGYIGSLWRVLPDSVRSCPVVEVERTECLRRRISDCAFQRSWVPYRVAMVLSVETNVFLGGGGEGGHLPYYPHPSPAYYPPLEFNALFFYENLRSENNRYRYIIYRNYDIVCRHFTVCIYMSIY